MFFSRKKKLLKDREAGLIFNWRQSRGYQLGKISSLIMSALIFVFALYALKVKTVQPSVELKREGVVTMVDPEDPRNQGLMMHISRNSPFPPRWDPAHDVTHADRVNQKLDDLLGAKSTYDPKLLPMQEEQARDLDVSVIGPDLPEWVAAASDEGGASLKGAAHADMLNLSVSMRSEGAWAKRIEQSSYVLPHGFLSEESYGQSYEFIVALNSHGSVLSCLPVIGGSMDALKASESQKQLASWFSQQAFLPADDSAVTVGVVELEVAARKGAK